MHEFMLEPDSELELSLEPPSSLRRGRQQERDIDRLLQENMHYNFTTFLLPCNYLTSPLLEGRGCQKIAQNHP